MEMLEMRDSSSTSTIESEATCGANQKVWFVVGCLTSAPTRESPRLEPTREQDCILQEHSKTLLKKDGVVADHTKSIGHNLAPLRTPKWYTYYFSRPGNMACHDLTNNFTPPPTFRSLLGLGLNFCVIPEPATRRMQERLERFRRDLYLRVFFASNELSANNLFVRSKWEPPPGEEG
jgi:hypothetical protein